MHNLPRTSNDAIVTPDNFNRAETDMYFRWMIKLAGGIGCFHHRREVMPIEWQTVVRPNRDTLYSSAVFDLDAAPVTITLPDSGARFMSMLILDQDQFAPAVVHGTGRHVLSRAQIGTRYAMAEVRTLVDPRNPHDLAGGASSPGCHRHLSRSARGGFRSRHGTEPVSARSATRSSHWAERYHDSRGMFGSRAQVDPIRHLIGTAMHWGGNPEEEATYLNVTPRMNDGTTVHRLTVRDVPVDGFWSISVYDADGYFEPSTRHAYSVNSLTATRNHDGSVTVQFGGCDSQSPNCLSIMPGWNYMVRLYSPRAEILNGSWVFPLATPVVAKPHARAFRLPGRPTERRIAADQYMRA